MVAYQVHIICILVTFHNRSWRLMGVVSLQADKAAKSATAGWVTTLGTLSGVFVELWTGNFSQEVGPSPSGIAAWKQVVWAKSWLFSRNSTNTAKQTPQCNCTVKPYVIRKIRFPLFQDNTWPARSNQQNKQANKLACLQFFFFLPPTQH